MTNYLRAKKLIHLGTLAKMQRNPLKYGAAFLALVTETIIRDSGVQDEGTPLVYGLTDQTIAILSQHLEKRK